MRIFLELRLFIIAFCEYSLPVVFFRYAFSILVFSSLFGNLIKRFFNKIKHFRRIATRYEKHAANYLAMVKLAAIQIWLRVNESMAWFFVARACRSLCLRVIEKRKIFLGRVIPKRINILGVNVSAIDMPMALEVIDGWIANREPNYVCIRDVNGVMACQEDEEFRKIHNVAGMVTPDGMPLVWASRLMGFRQVKRVSGVDLMTEVCAHSVSKGYRHFFYGCEPRVLENLETKLKARFPGLEIAGKHSPPFRPLTEAEDGDVVRMINKSGADIIWVGLGTPKQEQWMADHIGRLKAPVLIGNGAALDFLSGNLKRAPVWMQRSGLEWFHRLASEPRRLWRRYLVVTPRFIPLVLLQILGLRRYPLDADGVAGADSAS